jgi:hypothetical protein
MSISQPLLGRAIQGLNDLSSAVGDVKLGTLLVAMIGPQSTPDRSQHPAGAVPGAHRAHGRRKCHRARKPARRELFRCGIGGGGTNGGFAIVSKEKTGATR